MNRFQSYEDYDALTQESHKLDEMATQGPWFELFDTSDEDGFCEPYSTGYIISADSDDEICTCRIPHSPDSQFIARSRTLIPELTDRLERLLAYIKHMEHGGVFKTLCKMEGALREMTARATTAEIENQLLHKQVSAFNASNHGLAISHDNLMARVRTAETDLAVYQTGISVVQEKWRPSECPRCHSDFSDFEPCDDGHYKRARRLERCPYCGQKLMWS